MARFHSFLLISIFHMDFLGGSNGKVSACNAGDPGSIPGSERSPGEGNGNPLQYSCLEDPMDGGAWQATVHGILQARIVEWVAIPPFRGSSQPRNWTWVSCIAGRHFTVWATREALCSNSCPLSQWCCLTVLFSAALILLLPSIFPSIRVFSNESPQVYIFRIIGKYYT